MRIILLPSYFEKNMSKLWQARFFKTANHLRDLPKLDVPEIAFAGRSNAGKSSAINILCNQKNLAYASKTPGRTQYINFFSVGGAHVAQHRHDPIDEKKIDLFLVDLPGYGYAQVSGSIKSHWHRFLSDYLIMRPQIKGLILVMDARRPFQPLDTDLLEWFAATGKPIHCLLTKADKLNRQEATDSLKQTNTTLKSYMDDQGNPFSFSAQLFSSTKRLGLDTATSFILNLTGQSEKSPQKPTTS